MTMFLTRTVRMIFLQIVFFEVIIIYTVSALKTPSCFKDTYEFITLIDGSNGVWTQPIQLEIKQH